MEPTPATPCLGLIGGLGVGAGIFYYRELAKAFAAANRPLPLVMAHADMTRVLGHVEAGRPHELAQYLASLIERLAAAGATVAVVPAVTPHYCAPELARLSPLPLIDILDCTAAELARRNLRSVAIFGTRFVMASALFGRLGPVDVVPLPADDVDLVHRTYLEVAARGVGTPAHRELFTSIAHRLIAEQRVECILFAGTDLALVFDEAEAPTDFPHLDCARVHLAAILQALA